MAAEPILNELSVDIAQATADLTSDTATAEVTPDNDETLDVESSWESKEGDESTVKEADEKTAVKPVQAVTETIKYKANGKEMSVSLQEAQRRLALQDGSRKAFAERDTARKELEKARAEAAAGAKAQDTWNKLEAIKHDPEQLFKAITGKTYTEHMQTAIAREKALANATPEQRAQMQWQEDVAKERAERQAERTRRDRETAEANNKLEAAEKKFMHGQLEHEFKRFSFAGKVKDPAVANQLNEMVWVPAVTALQALAAKDGPDAVTPERIRHEMGLRYKAVASTLKAETTNQVTVATQHRRAAAKQTVQATAERGAKDALDIDDAIRKSAGSPTKLLSLFRQASQRG